MVSKMTRKSPPRSVKDCRGRRRKRSPAKGDVAGAAAVVLTSMNDSLFTCRRCLLKMFTKIAKACAPKSRKQSYEILPKSPEPTQPVTGRLPPSTSPEKKTIFLDLDETLVHSQTGPPPASFDFVVHPVIDGEAMTFYVKKRPFVDEFLAAIGRRFEVVVFTAGLEEYASLVLDRLDPAAVIAHRLYRDSCCNVDGRFVKDLAMTGRDLGRVAIVDDNPNAYSLQPENAIPVKPYIDDRTDGELLSLIAFFDGCDCFENLMDAAKIYRSCAAEESLTVGV